MNRDYRDLVIEDLAASEAALMAQIADLALADAWPQRAIRLLYERDLEIARLRRSVAALEAEVAALKAELQRITSAAVAARTAA